MGFFVWNSETSCLRGDSFCAEILGFTATNFRHGVSIDEVVQAFASHAKTALSSSPTDWSAALNSRCVSFESTEGSARRILFSLQYQGCDGLGIMHDVTTVSRSNDALQEYEALLCTIESLNIGSFFMLDRAGDIVSARRSLRKGSETLQISDVWGRYWPDLWKGEERRLAERALSLAHKGEPCTYHVEEPAIDGAMQRWQIHVAPIQAKENREWRILCLCSEASEQSEEHERLELALQAGAIAGTWLWDARTQRLTGDNRAATTLSVSREQMLKGIPLGHVFERISPSDRSRVKRALVRALRSEGRFVAEFRIQDKEHLRWRWVEADGHCRVAGPAGNTHFPGILLDVDEKKRQAIKREALNTLGEGLRSLHSEEAIIALSTSIMGEILEADRTGFAYVDPARRLAMVDKVWQGPRNRQKITGLYSFQSLGMDAERLSKGQIVDIANVHESLLSGNGVTSLEGIGVNAALYVPLIENGHLQAVVFVHYRQQHLWDAINISFVRSIADRSWSTIRQFRAQDALQRINENLEGQVARRTRERDRIWAISADLLALMDLDGRLCHLNPSWERCLGARAASFIGTKFDQLVHPQDRLKASSVVEGLKIERQDGSIDIRLPYKDGEWHTFNWSGFLDGEYLYLIGRDISDRIRLEEQLRQSQKMEAVGQLTGGIAHDFNNILAGIGGALDLLSSRIAAGKTSNLNRYIVAAQDATDRAAALTHRLLAFSRRQALDPKLTDVNELVSGMAELIRRTIGPSVKLRLGLSENREFVHVDPNQLENALLNLSINARDAMPAGGILAIETRKQEINEETAEELSLHAGAFLVMRVSDTGIGMVPEIAARAFDPFFTTKPLGKGTGLGLSMIYGFAQQSGGRTSIDSTPGHGTSIELWLPSYEGPIELTSTRPSSKPTGNKTSLNLKILLVDDDSTLRFTLSEMLREWGNVVDVAHDGASALALLRDADRFYDLLITDVGMPGGMNGRQLADTARENRPHLAILFITGYAEQGVFDAHPMEANMQLLAKPFLAKTLNEKLQNVAASRADAAARAPTSLPPFGS